MFQGQVTTQLFGIDPGIVCRLEYQNFLRLGHPDGFWTALDEKQRIFRGRELDRTSLLKLVKSFDQDAPSQAPYFDDISVEAKNQSDWESYYERRHRPIMQLHCAYNDMTMMVYFSDAGAHSIPDRTAGDHLAPTKIASAHPVTKIASDVGEVILVLFSLYGAVLWYRIQGVLLRELDNNQRRIEPRSYTLAFLYVGALWVGRLILSGFAVDSNSYRVLAGLEECVCWSASLALLTWTVAVLLFRGYLRMRPAIETKEDGHPSRSRAIGAHWRNLSGVAGAYVVNVFEQSLDMEFGLFPMIGIFGTFLGLGLAISNTDLLKIISNLGYDSRIPYDMWVGLIAGVGVAIFASLFGTITAIWARAASSVHDYCRMQSQPHSNSDPKQVVLEPNIRDGLTLKPDEMVADETSKTASMDEDLKALTGAVAKMQSAMLSLQAIMMSHLEKVITSLGQIATDAAARDIPELTRKIERRLQRLGSRISKLEGRTRRKEPESDA